MADELNTIRTTELELLDTSQVVDILVNSSDDAGRITLQDFLASIDTSSDWYSVTSKPFTDLDLEYFSTKISDEGFTVLTFNEDISTALNNLQEISNITNGLSTRITTLETDSHIHDNKEIIDLFSVTEENKLLWNDAEVGYKLTPATTESLGGVKPDGNTITIDEDGTLHGANTYELPAAAADSLGGVKVDNTDINISEDGVIHLGIASIDTLGGVKIDGDSIAINEDGTIFAVPKGLDFQAIAAAMTGGTSNGLEITADEGLEVFNFNVTKTPEIKIDNEGYWTVDGDRGTNPTKAQGEKGDNGVSPIASVTETETGATITITDGSGTTTANISNGTDGADGISPHIDEATNHWFIGETDTGIGATAAIDDTSTDGTDVSWSAHKIKTELNNINTSLHYSTSEQLIGTWIDGSPLYQKTIVFNADKSKEWIKASLGNELYNVISHNSYIEFADGSVNIPIPTYRFPGEFAQILFTPTTVELYMESDGYLGTCYSTIRYTKG